MQQHCTVRLHLSAVSPRPRPALDSSTLASRYYVDICMHLGYYVDIYMHLRYHVDMKYVDIYISAQWRFWFWSLAAQWHSPIRPLYSLFPPNLIFEYFAYLNSLMPKEGL